MGTGMLRECFRRPGGFWVRNINTLSTRYNFIIGKMLLIVPYIFLARNGFQFCLVQTSWEVRTCCLQLMSTLGTMTTPSTPGSTMSLPLLHSGWTALSLYLYIIFLSFLYFVSRFGHSLVPATLLSMVEGKSNKRPKQISLKEVFLAKAQHCPPSMIYHRL